ncbi:MAG: hypothetical protein PHC61_00955, partial [Chitinivibrionales bacterium]|nr:hypothetical protein [Chitinivibrionales bacterium]
MKRTLMLRIVLIGFMGLFARPAHAQWVLTYAGDSYIQALAIKGSSIFAGTNGGIFLSTNNGAQWKPVNTGLLNKQI